MRSFAFAAVTASLLAGCGSQEQADQGLNAPAEANASAAAEPAATPEATLPDSNASAAAAAPAPARASAARWTFQSSGEGASLALLPASGGTSLRLFCPAGGKSLLVNVPAFRPIGSEERLSLGSGGTVAALVADIRGDKQRGGVSATGAVPGNLAALIAGRVSASYGNQVSGPHPAPPRELARSFATACADAAPAAAAKGGPCMTQGSERLTLAPLRAVGTEPFWGARIEGRCVTYSHPEDQKGTRIWTRYAPARGGGTWTGTLGGKPFVLRTRAKAGCSDGMSDTRYQIAVELLVAGETRKGCAAPL